MLRAQAARVRIIAQRSFSDVAMLVDSKNSAEKSLISRSHLSSRSDTVLQKPNDVE